MAPDSVVHGDLLQESEALGLGEVRSLQLAKVELHCTIVAHDAREKGLAVQSVLADLESNSWLAAILGEGQHRLLTLQVLSKKIKKCKAFWMKTKGVNFNLLS